MDLLRKFYNADVPQSEEASYGYEDDTVKVSSFDFGLNAGKCFLTKFEWIPNAGKDGAEMEALDIIFTINGTPKNYRMFPVKKAYGKNNEEITDPKAKEFKEAVSDFNARVTHILHAFQDIETIKASMSRVIKGFKDFCNIAASILPKDFATRPLDIFMQYQWQPSEGQNRTFLDIPRKMSYGAWLKPAQPGTWIEKRAQNITENTREALWYENEKGEKHPFVKNGWFMLSHFANQQREDGSSQNQSQNQQVTQTAAKANAEGEKKASAW